MKRLLALMVLILCVTPAGAEYAIGYQSDGYSYTGNGYWSYQGSTYTRYLVQYPGYWSGGCYYPGTSYYTYKQSYAPAAAKVDYTDPGWRAKLLDIAAQRDKFEGELRKGRYDQAYFLDTVKALGLEGNFRWEGYGVAPPSGYGYYGNGSYGNGSPSRYMPYELSGTVNYGVNGTSQYGYSYNTIASLYGDTSLSALYQQAGQLANGAQTLSAQATSGFSGLVGQEGNNRARVAEIIVKADAAHKILMAMQDPAMSAGYSFKISPQGQIIKTDEGVRPEVRSANAEKWHTLVATRCASCHSGGTKKGAFDIASYPNMTPEAKQKVWQILVTEDEKTRMPRLPDGGPGRRLTPEEVRLFILN